MTLIIKTTGAVAPAGAKKLFRDVMVENGTLLLVDFSNRGTLDNFNINNGKSIFDLSREASVPLGVTNTATSTFDAAITLTEGKGVSPIMGSIGRSIAPQGVKFNGSLQSYLATKQPHSLCIFWARRKADSVDPNPANIVGSYAGATLNNNLGISAPSAGQSFIMRFGGVITTQLAFATPFGQLAQIAIEFNGIGQPVNLYKDGAVFSTPSFGSATGFVASDSMVIGKHDWGDPSRTALYRMIVEDLAVSGRSALSVVQKDYNYVKATGDFAGIVKRPFVDAF